MLCSTPGCQRPALARTLCSLHYQQARRGEIAMPPGVRLPNGGLTCKVTGCGLVAHCRGWCPKHYRRWRLHGDVDVSRQPRSPSLLRRDPSNLPNISCENTHYLLRRLWGSASQYPCVDCGQGAAQWAYDGTDQAQLYGPAGRGKANTFYSVWPEFYKPMCHRCHKRHDLRERRLVLDVVRGWMASTGSGVAELTAVLSQANRQSS